METSRRFSIRHGRHFHIYLFVLLILYTQIVLSIYQGCVVSDCGQPCPSNFFAQAPIRRANRVDSCSNSGLQPGQLCCPFPNNGGQWVPEKPYNTVDHHTCAVNDPCPALGKMSIFDDQWGDLSSILCFTGTYWYCENQPPKENPGMGNFKSLGCYTDSTTSRGLSGSTVDWSGMTVAKCLDIAKNYKYAAVEYYGECRYGNALASSSTKSSGCSTPCVGNTAEFCGGADRMTLYENTAYQPPAKENPGVGNFQSMGCYTDSTQARGLSEVAYDWEGMTVSKCVEIAKNYKYAGVEFYGECHYGNTLASTSIISTGCNTPCVGNQLEWCGGAERMNLYTNSAYQPPATQNPGVGTFNVLGCYTDSSVARTLSTAFVDWDGMTVAKCVAAAGGHKYAGVEFYGECYYGNTLAATSTMSTGCDTPCVGNKAELCGGADRLTVYENTAYRPPPVATVVPSVGNWQSRGCFADSASPRSLTGGSQTDSAMTVNRCVELSKGWKYAGLENKSECYWGDALTASTSTDCSSACGGDATQLCGASRKLNVYENTAWQDLTRIQLAGKLEEFYQICADVTADVNSWLNELKSSQTRKKRQFGWVSVLRNRKTGFIQIASTVDDLFATARNHGTIDEHERQSFETTRSSVSNTLDEAINSFTYPPPQQLQVAQRSSTTLGAPAIGFGVGAGIFYILGGLILLLKPFSGGGGGGEASTIGSTSTPTIVVIPPSSTATTTSACSPTSTPSPLVVLTIQDSTRAQYDALILSLKQQLVVITEQILYDPVNFRAFVAEMDECQRKLIIKDPIVSTVSRPALGVGDDGTPVSGSKRATPARLRERGSSNSTFTTLGNQLVSRDKGPGIKLREQKPGNRYQNKNNHLRWLTSPWAKTNIPSGVYYDFQTFVYEDTSNPATHDKIKVFILDTGELRGNIGSLMYDAVRRVAGSALDTDGHGTCMASHAGGIINGVYKDAVIVPVKILESSGSPPKISDVLDALGWISQHADSSTGAVLSMSVGFLPQDLKVDEGQTNFDPFPDLLSRLQRAGMVTVASTGNHADSKDNYKYLDTATPRMHGGAGSALIVVGNANWEGNRNPSSCFEYLNQDTGILSLYAMGTSVLCARHDNVDTFKTSLGSSQATAQVAGMAAYFLSKKNSPTQLRNGAQTSMTMKSHLQNLARVKKGTWPDGIPRAALDHEMLCTGKPSEGVARIPEYNIEEDGMEMTLDEYPRVHDISDGDTILDEEQMPPCLTFPAV